jgi:hypothetical protein
LARELYSLLPEIDSRIDLRLLPAGLHESPLELNRILQREIDQIAQELDDFSGSITSGPKYQAILLGFGLCGRATVGLVAPKIPLVLPRAHDCITLLLGSKERYQACFSENSANFWYSSGWIERLLPPGPERSQILKGWYEAKFGFENAAYLLEAEMEQNGKYSQATLIRWNLPQDEYYRKYVKDCAAASGWDYRELQGDPALLRALLTGDWNEDRFQVIQSGEKVEASFDERIVTLTSAGRKASLKRRIS